MNPMMGLINNGQTPVTPEIVTNSPTSQTVELIQTASRLKPVLQQLKTSGNPSQMLSQMCMQNPQFKQAYETARSIAGNNPKEAFMTRARSMGIDPNAVIAALGG